MFEIGEYIVYGMNGVCRVEEIGPMNLSGYPKLCIFTTFDKFCFGISF